MTYEYGKWVDRMFWGDQRLFLNDESAWKGRWEPSQPEATATLWRYMTFAKFCSLLERQALFFALVGDMTDKYEGFIYPPTPRKSADRLQPAEDIGQVVLREIAQSALINCWTEADHESSLMWDAYAGEEGVAIRTHFQDLKSSLLLSTPELPLCFGKVTYVDYRKQESLRFVHAPLFQKRVEYGGEAEVRAALPPPRWDSGLDPDKLPRSPINITLDSDVERQRGRYIPVNLNVLVKEVVLHPHSAKWFGQLVQSVVDQSPVDANVTPSSLNVTPDNMPGQ